MFTASTMLITALVVANVILAAALLGTTLIALQLYAEDKERDQ